MPPYQRNGHCTYLLQSVYDDLVPNSNVIDITGRIKHHFLFCFIDWQSFFFQVECPSNNFVKVRDYVDAKNFLNLKLFHDENFKNISNNFYNNDVKLKIHEKLKLSKVILFNFLQIFNIFFFNQ